jgi:aspartyl-tRNA(Asn)/glutamyl-tRNA(Gln) amidotransferase subunit B
MQEGSFRCDANVSVRPRGETALGTRCEIKNVNSFRFVEKAIAYEIERQIREREAGRAIVQETRLYDETRDATRSMRGKESAHDYRYFPDPDLPPMVIDTALLDAVRAGLPELPEPRRRRYLEALALPAIDAEALTAERPTSDFFEAVLAELGPAQAKLAANWVLGEWATRMHERATAADPATGDPAASPVSATQLAILIRRVLDGTLSSTAAKAVFGGLWMGEGEVDAIIAARGLAQVNDDGALSAAIDQVLAASPTQVGQFKAGDEKVFGWLVGQVMRAMRGKANPQRLNELLRSRLA